MFYRVSADLVFTEEDEAKDFLHDCQVALPKSSVINPGQNNEERSTILTQNCYHDEDPVKPCEQTGFWQIE